MAAGVSGMRSRSRRGLVCRPALGTCDRSRLCHARMRGLCMYPARSRVERRGRGGAAAGGHVDVARVRRSCRVHRTVGAEPRLAFRITTLLRRRALASHEHHSSARLSLGSRIPAKSHLPWPLSGDDDRFGIYLRLQTCRARRELSGGTFGGAGGQRGAKGRAPLFQPLSDRLHT